MKTLTSLLVLIFPLFVQAQEEVDTNIVFECYYILDETWTSSNFRHYKLDQKPNVFKIKNNVLYFQSIIRGKGVGHGTSLKELKVATEDSVTIITFEGKRIYRDHSSLSGTIKEHKNGMVKIHIYTKLGSFERYYIAHKASESEIQEIKDFYE